MDSMDEPLNLTVKKMPVAIVAPFTFADSNHKNKKEDNKIETLSNKDDIGKSIHYKNDDDDPDLPQDLSLNNKNNTERNKNYNLNVDNTEQLRKYLCKSDIKNLYDKNTYNETMNSKSYQCNNFHSLLDNLNNKIPFWYFFNNNETSQGYDSSNHYSNKTLESNSILNNLLDKKPQNHSDFPTDFSLLIKNEMRKTHIEKG